MIELAEIYNRYFMRALFNLVIVAIALLIIGFGFGFEAFLVSVGLFGFGFLAGLNVTMAGLILGVRDDMIEKGDSDE